MMYDRRSFLYMCLKVVEQDGKIAFAYASDSVRVELEVKCCWCGSQWIMCRGLMQVLCSPRIHHVRCQEAVKKGKKMWNHCKIMLMGHGRAGKTCLVRALLNKPIVDMESTEALDVFTVGIKLDTSCSSGYASSSGYWHEPQPPTLLLEDAIGSMALECSAEAEEEPLKQNGVLTSLWQRFLTPKSQKQVSSKLSVNKDVIIDTMSVMRRAADARLGKSHVQLSIYDFGGQDVFHCLHPYFMTKCGICIVVFNMVRLASEFPVYSANGLSHLSFWLNAVVLNTSHGAKTTPVFLVGTHSDIVDCPEAHLRVSRLLSAAFCKSKVWSSIVINVADELIFFPVDNGWSGNDCVYASEGSVGRLGEAITSVLMKDESMKVERPLTWYHALDNLRALHREGRHSVALKVAVEVLINSGIEAQNAGIALGVFRDMGMLLWYEENALRDTVILDPVAYFAKPVSRVICDSQLHCKEAHDFCALRYFGDYQLMTQKGIISQPLLAGLLDFGDTASNSGVLITLMLKYHLLVAWAPRDNHSIQYFVPALFPSDDIVHMSINSYEQGVPVLRWS
jgi:GTPase SAR1 family protein